MFAYTTLRNRDVQLCSTCLFMCGEWTNSTSRPLWPGWPPAVASARQGKALGTLAQTPSIEHEHWRDALIDARYSRISALIIRKCLATGHDICDIVGGNNADKLTIAIPESILYVTVFMIKVVCYRLSCNDWLLTGIHLLSKKKIA